MSWSPSPSWIQRWFPERWSEIAGNSKMIQVWKNFLVNGPCNALFTGPNRSGKTRTISLGIRALVCTNRTPSLDPSVWIIAHGIFCIAETNAHRLE